MCLSGGNNNNNGDSVLFTPFKDLSSKQQYVQYLHITWLLSSEWNKACRYYNKMNSNIKWDDNYDGIVSIQNNK
eukprot:UN10377